MNLIRLLTIVIIGYQKYSIINNVNLNSMQQFFSIFAFYKPFILWSLIINMIFSFLEYEIIPILILKLLLVIFLWYFLNETYAKRKLTFYKNLGISTLKLFTLLYIIDFVFSLPFLILLREFI